MGARVAFTDRTPWAVGVEGALISAESARGVIHDTTAGAEGVVAPGDLRVRPLDVPGTSVRVAPGSVVVLNRYPGGSGQSYRGRTASTLEVPITATGSASGRSDLVVARIIDPQSEPGLDPDDIGDPNDFDYVVVEVIEGVSPSTGRASSVPQLANVPAYALARIDLPATTGTVEGRHVTSLRGLVMPQTRLASWTDNPATTRTVATPDGQWVNLFSLHVGTRIPEWATRAHATVLLSGLIVRTGDFQGEFRLRLGSGSSARYTTERVPVTEDSEGTRGRRFAATLGSFIENLSALAGESAAVAIEVRRTAGSNGLLEVHAGGSSASVSVNYLQTAV